MSLNLFSTIPTTSILAVVPTPTTFSTVSSATLKPPTITPPVDVIVKSTPKKTHSLAVRSDDTPLFPLDYCSDVPPIVRELNKNDSFAFDRKAIDAYDGPAVVKTGRVSLKEPCPGFEATKDQTCEAWKEASKGVGNSTQAYSRFNQTLPLMEKLWPACKPPDAPYTTIPSASTASTCTAPFDAMYSSLTAVDDNGFNFDCKTIEPSTTASSVEKPSITSSLTTHSPTANAAPRAGSIFSYASPAIRSAKKGVRALGKASGFRAKV